MLVVWNTLCSLSSSRRCPRIWNRYIAGNEKGMFALLTHILEFPVHFSSLEDVVWITNFHLELRNLKSEKK